MVGAVERGFGEHEGVVGREVAADFYAFLEVAGGFLFGRVKVFAADGEPAAVASRALDGDFGFLGRRQGEEDFGGGVGVFDQRIGDAVVGDVEEADGFRGVADLGGDVAAVVRRAVEERGEVDEGDGIELGGDEGGVELCEV